MDQPAAEAWSIQPNGPLVGEVRVRGSKNAVSKHMVAAMLGTEPSTITNAPEVGEVGITADILTSLGVGVDIEGDRITVQPTATPGAKVPLEFTGLNRIPILLLGPAAAPQARGVRAPGRAATASADARSTSTSRRSRRWAPRSR